MHSLSGTHSSAVRFAFASTTRRISGTVKSETVKTV